MLTISGELFAHPERASASAVISENFIRDNLISVRDLPNITHQLQRLFERRLPEEPSYSCANSIEVSPQNRTSLRNTYL